MGDEEQYLLKCNNKKIVEARKRFMADIREKNTEMNALSENIINYCMLMHDQNYQMCIATYIKIY